MHVAIRADGSQYLGLGHLYRSSIVAAEMLTRGHQVTVVTQTPEYTSHVAPADVNVETLSGDSEIDAFTEWINSVDVDAIVTDSYDIGTSYQRRLCETGAELIVILDDARHVLHADVLVNGNIYAPELDYEWENAEPKWCLGTDFLLLREPFRTYAADPQPFPVTVDNIVVTMGGVDRENRTPTVMRALDSHDVNVSVIVGPGFSNNAEIRRTAAKLGGEISIHEDPENLAELFLGADLAVCTLGTTTYELLATQTPIVGIPDNDTPMPAALESANAAVVLPHMPAIDDIDMAVSRVRTDTKLRQSLWRAGKELVTADGPANVAEAIENSVSD